MSSPAEWWLAGYVRGVQSGHALGLEEGDRALIEAALGFLEQRGPLRNAPRRLERPADPTTGAELVARARASWGLSEENLCLARPA